MSFNSFHQSSQNIERDRLGGNAQKHNILVMEIRKHMGWSFEFYWKPLVAVDANRAGSP